LRNLFQFILRHSTFLIFIILEGFSFYLIIQYNINQREVFINTSNNISNFIKQTTGGIKRYFNLKTENDFLNQQNAYLLNYIFINKHHNQKINNRDYLFFADKNYSFIPGIIISNSTLWQKNLITINKGTIDGISSDMAVVGPTGIIGVIFKSSSHFSTVISLLNKDTLEPFSALPLVTTLKLFQSFFPNFFLNKLLISDSTLTISSIKTFLGIFFKSILSAKPLTSPVSLSIYLAFPPSINLSIVILLSLVL